MYQLIHESISSDTVEALEQLLDGAKRGEVIGIAYALMLKRRRFMIDCAGEACQSPLLARGAVAVLDDHLGEMIRGRTDRDTTL